MKKIITCSALLLLLGFTSSVLAQVQFGVKGGLNISTLSNYNKHFNDGSLSSVITPKIDNKQKFGFNSGLIAQIGVPHTDFFIQPELLFSNLGGKVEEKYKIVVSDMEFTNETKHSIHLNYLQIPIYAGYKFDMGVANLILGAGPYFAYGLWSSDDLFDDKEFKRFDAGISFMAGIELSKFQITAGYDCGVINKAKDKFWDNKKSYSLRNRNIKLSLGYFF